MTRLADLAQLIRSKNAGPFSLTFDILFDEGEPYRTVRDSGVINAELFATRYHADPAKVQIFHVDAARAIKITIPRRAVQGALDDTDSHGGQQFPPLMDVELPMSRSES